MRDRLERHRLAVGTAIALVVAVALLWIAGESHRENCIQEGRIGCSVMPWEDGDYASEPFSNPFDAVDP